MFYRFFLSFLALLFGVGLVAQPFKDYVKAGDQAFKAQEYSTALFHYEEALEIRPDAYEVVFQTAEAARLYGAYEVAYDYYEKILKKKQERNFPLTRFRLGTLDKQFGNYDQAIDRFKEYLAISTRRDARFSELAEAEIKTCQWAKELIENPSPIEIKHFGKNINTGYSEFGAIQRGDELYYSSYRYDFKEDKHRPKRKISKVLSAKEGRRGRPIRSFNAADKHTAHATFSSDNSRVYFTQCQFVEGSKIQCAIYYRDWDANRKRWKKKITKLPEAVNMPKYTATHPSIGFDSTLNAEVLYFVSDRPSGKGGLDIWWTLVEEEEKAFPKANNLEAINTAEDEMTPFFDKQRQQLFFSSNGQQSLGGLDVYQVQKDSSWGNVVNLGAPINSSYNDVYYSLNEDGQTGYLSSNRPGSFYLDKSNKTCCYDIYAFEPLPPEIEEPDPEDIDLTIGELPNEPNLEFNTAEPPVPTKLEDFLPLALYFDNDEPDKRTRRRTTKKTYTETYGTYIERKEEYLEAYTEGVDEDIQWEAEDAIQTFFEQEVERGYEYLNRFSEILLEKLQEEEQVEIFIKGYTSPRAKSDYNLALGQRRISCLRNHFDTYQEGAFLPFLESGQLVITERSFGEAEAAASISDVLEDLRNSIYSPEAARERRVEIVEIRR